MKDTYDSKGIIYIALIVFLLYYRRVQSESSTGTVTSERKRTILCIEVTDIHFDTQACTLRVNGKNVEENEHVKVCYWLSAGCFLCTFLDAFFIESFKLRFLIIVRGIPYDRSRVES